MVKLTDVAELAGVSPTTVSRVINNYGSLSEKTKRKVFSAMEELNYQPNSLARSLQGKQTKIIGVILPGVSNPFFGEMVEILENQLFKKGYRVILCNAGDDREKERAYLRMLMANKVDGIIAGAHNLDIKEYQSVNLPIVSFDRFLSTEIPIVSSDNLAGGKQAARTLMNAGGTKFHVFSGLNTPGSPTNSRLTGFQTELATRQLQTGITEFKYNVSANIKSLEIHRVLTDKAPNAIFCTDDLTALLVARQADQLALKIPRDLKVIGYDGTSFIQSYHPELTTIVQPIKDIVTLMIDILLDRITDPEKPFQKQYTLPIKLISGNSTGSVN